jgi:serine/threonine protein kinase
MKLVKGRSWEKIARDEFKALPAEEFLAKHLPILADVAQAVAFAHDRGVVHRDLKPGQVMVGEFGETLLMDWGLAIVYKTARRRGNRRSSPAPRFKTASAFPPSTPPPTPPARPR